MLIKTILTGNGDYSACLRQRRWAALALLAMGLVGFLCWFFLVPDSHLSEHARGFYLGAASGITAGSLLLLIRTQYLTPRPSGERKSKRPTSGSFISPAPPPRSPAGSPFLVWRCPCSSSCP